MFKFYNHNHLKNLYLETVYLCDYTEIAYFEYPYAGLLSFYTYYDSCCGGGQQEIKVKDLLTDRIILNLNINNYNFMSNEYPDEDPYKYLKEQGIEYFEVLDTYISGYIITPIRATGIKEWQKIKERIFTSYKKEIQAPIYFEWKLEKIYIDMKAIFLLDWDDKAERIKIPIEEVLAVGYDEYGYT